MPITGPEAGCRDAGLGWNGQPLESANLRLRTVAESDLDALVRLAGDAEIAKQTAEIPHPYGEGDGRLFIAKATEPLSLSGRLVFAIERRREPGLIGCIAFIDRADVADVGYWIGRPFWREGYATEAVQALLRLIFRGFSYERAEAEVLADNPASERVLTKAGFALVGDGTGCRGRCAGEKVHRFALSRADWQAREAAKPTIPVAAVALVDCDGRVLIARRPETKPMPGLWEFPGGKIKAGETPEAALIRELAEELGIDVTESCLAPVAFASHDYVGFHLLMPLFACRVWKGEITPREGQSTKWVKPARLADYPMPPADEPLIALLRDLL